jgi:4-hydroxybenzoate polyprenyltransferase
MSVAASASTGESTASPPAWRMLAKAVRLRQWTKNLAVFAPLLFAKEVFASGAALKATMAVMSFCLLASTIYVINDWVDRERDKLHPDKRKRPIAAGHLKGPGALTLGAFCGVTGGALAWATGIPFAQVAGSYVALQLAYSFFLKHLVIVDVMVIAIGFVIRVVGGGVAIGVPVSNWLFRCTLLLAVFLGLAKRRHELSSLAGEAVGHRSILDEYSVPMLDQMMSIVAAACIVAYGIYTVAEETIAHVGNDLMKYTVPFVIYGLFRYLFLVHKKNKGGSPERVLLQDPPLIICLVLYVAVAAWALYV